MLEACSVILGYITTNIGREHNIHSALDNLSSFLILSSPSFFYCCPQVLVKLPWLNDYGDVRDGMGLNLSNEKLEF